MSVIVALYLSRLKRSLLIILLFTLKTVSFYGQLSEAELKLIAPSPGFADDFDYDLDLEFGILQSSENKLPFWMHHNHTGHRAEDSRLTTYLSGKAVTYLSSNSQIFFGGGLYYHDGKDSGIQPAELYLHYNSPLFLLAWAEKINRNSTTDSLPLMKISYGPEMLCRFRGLGWELRK